MIATDRDGEEGGAAPGLEEVDVADGKPEVPGEMLVERHVAPGPADATRRAGRHLAEEGLVDRIGPVRDRGDLDHEARAGGPHVARVLPERALGLADAGRQNVVRVGADRDPCGAVVPNARFPACLSGGHGISLSHADLGDRA